MSCSQHIQQHNLRSYESVGSHAFWRIVEWGVRARSVTNGSNSAGLNPSTACDWIADLGWIARVIPTIAVIQLTGSLPRGTYILAGSSLPYARARNLFSLWGQLLCSQYIQQHNLRSYESVGSHAFQRIVEWGVRARSVTVDFKV